MEPPKLSVKVTHVQKAKLLTEQEWAQLKPERVIRSMRREILKQIRNKIQQETFSPAAKRALMNGMKVTVTEKTITVIATHPAFKPLLQGQKAGQMRWLTKARAPIPIITETGELIFRSATPKSMTNGSWVHPGRKKTTVIETAREEARKIVKIRMKTEIQRQFRALLKKERSK